MTNETEAPERMCVVNCGLPAMACACYRRMFASQFPANPMTNETEAPERIYLKPQDAALFNQKYGHPNVLTVMVGDDYVMYTLSDTQAARIAELEERNTALGEAVAYATQRIAELEAGEAEATRLMLGSQKRMRQYKARAEQLAAQLEAAEAKLAKAVRLMELSVELADWNTTLLDDVIFFIAELKELT